MEAILASFLQNGIKFILFICVAGAGVVLGKKYRDSKDAKKAAEQPEQKESL